MKAVKDYLHFLTTAGSLEELWPEHVARMADYGFDRLIYGNTVFRSGSSLGDPDDFVILSNHSKEYLEGFLYKGLYHHAPMTKWALENTGAASWRLNTCGEITEEQRKVLEFNRKMGVVAGYTISFPSSSSRRKGAMSLCARRGLSQDEVDAVWDEHGADILLMNNVAHLKILSLPYQPPKRALTQRQRQALEWAGDGLTVQDIATVMGLKPATVEKHLRLARDVLAVESTTQAVLKAALYNQMYAIDG